jgi:two-component system response regulator CpxR
MRRILIIDDDHELCELLSDYLSAEGLDIVSVHSGDVGPQAVHEHGVDLVILDVMLPGMNGFDVLRAIRRESQVPVIMLTARGEEIDRIVGLELGADDYLPKPFNPRELLARIRAVERRLASRKETQENPDSEGVEVVEVGDLRVYPGSRRVKCGHESVDLTSAEFDLLAMLARHKGEVVSRKSLVEEVLGRQNSPYDRSVDVHVSALRKKLGPDVDNAGNSSERIITVRNVGYMYADPEVS